MNDQFQILLEKDAVIDVVNQLFISTDNRDWVKVKACFANDVLFDMTSMTGGGSGKIIEVKELPQESRGRWGTGTVHHVAWRVKDSAEEMAMREIIFNDGLFPTEQIDRFWFKSVYFREPGEVLFELATDGPGFDRDEDMDHLGEQLILPPWLEPHRAQIEAALPRLEMPRISA